MNKRLLETLEYDKILSMLSTHAKCCVGKENAARLRPLSDKNEICGELELTAEAEALLYKLGNSPVDDFRICATRSNVSARSRACPCMSCCA